MFQLQEKATPCICPGITFLRYRAHWCARLQVKIFGGYTRWAVDMQAPDSTTPARMVLTTVDAAARAAMATPAGPVHLNLQFREPLAPVEADWSAAVLKVGCVHLHLS